MTGRAVDRLGMPRRRPVAPTVVWGAEVGATFQHFARDAMLRLTGIIAQLFFAAARVLRNAARLGRVGLVAGIEPVRCPLPDVADHVVEAVVIVREGRYRRGALVTILHQILPRKLTLPGVGHHLTARVEFAAQANSAPSWPL